VRRDLAFASIIKIVYIDVEVHIVLDKDTLPYVTVVAKL
jgi:hypothetical protein